VRDEIENYRFEYMSTVVRALAKLTRLRMPAKRAAQIVWTLASPDVGRMLCDVQGWTTEQYADWLEQTLAATLLP
jgi:hypothetical protein